MNAHVKTVLTIVAGFSTIAALVASPKLALVAWIGLWIVVAMATGASIYGMLYVAYDQGLSPPSTPEKPVIDRNTILPALIRPGMYAGEQGDRSRQEWIADAIAEYINCSRKFENEDHENQ